MGGEHSDLVYSGSLLLWLSHHIVLPYADVFANKTTEKGSNRDFS